MHKELRKYALVATFKSLWVKGGLRFCLRPLESSVRYLPKILNRTEASVFGKFGSVRSYTETRYYSHGITTIGICSTSCITISLTYTSFTIFEKNQFTFLTWWKYIRYLISEENTHSLQISAFSPQAALPLALHTHPSLLLKKSE